MKAKTLPLTVNEENVLPVANTLGRKGTQQQLNPSTEYVSLKKV